MATKESSLRSHKNKAKAKRRTNADALRLTDLKSDPRNPREITDRSAKGLQASIEKFGDISGIVFNKRSGFLVCGHQRLEQLQKVFGDDVKVIGNEIVCPNGWKFPIRVVDWDEQTARAAMIAANSEAIAGTFTTDIDELLSELQETNPGTFEELNLDELLLVDVYEPDDGVDKEFAEAVTVTPGGKKIIKKLWVYFEADTLEQYEWLLEQFAAVDENGKASQRLLNFLKLKKLILADAPPEVRKIKSTPAVKKKRKKA